MRNSEAKLHLLTFPLHIIQNINREHMRSDIIKPHRVFIINSIWSAFLAKYSNHVSVSRFFKVRNFLRISLTVDWLYFQLTFYSTIRSVVIFKLVNAILHISKHLTYHMLTLERFLRDKNKCGQNSFFLYGKKYLYEYGSNFANLIYL